MTTLKSSGSSSSRRPKTLFSHVRYEHLLAGISGGVASTLILHPLDLLKIRFAVSDGRTGVVRVGGGVAEAAAVRPQYRTLAGAISSIVQQEGFRGLYRGVTPNVWGSGSAWGFYFLFYNAIKTWIQGGNTKKPLGPGLHMLAAAEAGILTLIMTNPIWVVKTRLCLQYGEPSLPSSVQLSESQSYKGMLDALKKIYTYEGIRGLYKGFVPGIFGVSHGALQFMTYEEMKNFYNHYRDTPIDTRLTTLEYLSFAAMSKLCAAAATYPYQVVRARLQDQRGDYTGTMDCVRRTWRFEGVRGFYKGIAPNLLRVTPATAITFVVYENVSGYLLKPNAESDSNEVTPKIPLEDK